MRQKYQIALFYRRFILMLQQHDHIKQLSDVSWRQMTSVDVKWRHTAASCTKAKWNHHNLCYDFCVYYADYVYKPMHKK